jgi:hypothetical protein
MSGGLKLKLETHSTYRPPISWPPRYQDKKQCAVVKKFEHVNIGYAPSKDPHDPELVFFESGVAAMLEKQGLIVIRSWKVDRGVAKLEKRGLEVKAYRPWPGSLPGQPESQVYPKNDPFLAVELVKHVQVFPGIDIELFPGDIFVTTYSAVKQLGHSVEGIESGHYGPLVVLQP